MTVLVHMVHAADKNAFPFSKHNVSTICTYTNTCNSFRTATTTQKSNSSASLLNFYSMLPSCTGTIHNVD